MNSPSNHDLQEGSADLHSEKEDNSTPATTVIISCVVNPPLMLISILGNALVLAAIIRTPSIRSTPHMIMLCSLAVSDFLVGLIAQPIYLAEQLTKTGSIYLVWKITASTFSVASLIAITAITVDRFLALHYHMRYATLVTESRVKYTLIIIWLSSFLLSCFQFWNTRAQHLSMGLVILICLIISILSYIRIYRIVRRHQIQIHVQQQAVQSSDAENNLNIARLEKSARSTFVFYIALIMCYLPLYMVLTLSAISQWNFQIEWDFASTLIFLNSSINPFLYCWRVRELRTAVAKTARKMLCKEAQGN